MSYCYRYIDIPRFHPRGQIPHYPAISRSLLSGKYLPRHGRFVHYAQGHRGGGARAVSQWEERVMQQGIEIDKLTSHDALSYPYRYEAVGFSVG